MAVSPFCTPFSAGSIATSARAMRRKMPPSRHKRNHPGDVRSEVSWACSSASSSPGFTAMPSLSSECRTGMEPDGCADYACRSWPAHPHHFLCRRHSAFTTGGASGRHVARRSVPPRHNNEADVASEASDQSYKTYNNGASNSGKPRANDELSASERLVQVVSTVLPAVRNFCANNFLLLGTCAADSEAAQHACGTNGMPPRLTKTQ